MIIEGTFKMDTKTKITNMKISLEKKVDPEKFVSFLGETKIEVENQEIITQAQSNYINALATDFSKSFGENTQHYKTLLKEMFCDKYNLPFFSTKTTTKTNASNFISFIIETGIDWGVQFKIPPHVLGTEPERYTLACLKSKVCAKCGQRHEDGITIDLHHAKTVNSNGGRAINDDNLPKIPLCRACHQFLHSIGQRRFTELFNIKGVEYKSEIWYGKRLWTRLSKNQEYQKILEEPEQDFIDIKLN